MHVVLLHVPCMDEICMVHACIITHGACMVHACIIAHGACMVHAPCMADACMVHVATKYAFYRNTVHNYK